jgi:nitrous oxidase accessory protein NosD
VAAGTYAEHVSINKDLTVNSAGAGQTIVDGTQSGTVFTVNGGTVSLSAMTVTNGHRRRTAAASSTTGRR